MPEPSEIGPICQGIVAKRGRSRVWGIRGTSPAAPADPAAAPAAAAAHLLRNQRRVASGQPHVRQLVKVRRDERVVGPHLKSHNAVMQECTRKYIVASLNCVRMLGARPYDVCCPNRCQTHRIARQVMKGTGGHAVRRLQQ